MSNARIGALHVALGIDSAKFTAGLKGAQKELGAFSTSMKVLQTAMIGAVTGIGIERLGSAIGTATKQVAELNRNARILGASFKDMQTLASVFAERGIG